MEEHAAGRGWRTAFLVIVPLLAATVLFLSYQLYLENAEERTREEVLSVARRFAVHLTTYRHDTLDKDVDEVLSLSTGSFRKDYEEVLGGETFRKSLVEVKGESKGRIISIALVSLEGEEASVVAVVERTTSNTELSRPQVKPNRLELSLLRTASGWKVERVDRVTEL